MCSHEDMNIRKVLSENMHTSTCVMIIELNKKPGKYKLKNDKNVDKILGAMLTPCAAINSAIDVSRSMATNVAR